MAKQRQTDVNINYHVNTVEVDKADQLLKKVSQTTDQARAATNNFGQQAGKAFQSTSKHIEGMEIELARLRQQIKLTSTEDKARLELLSNQYKQLKGQIDQYNKSLFEQSKATKQAATDTRTLVGQFGEVYTAAKLFVTAGFVKEVVTMSLEMAKLSGNVEGVKRAFDRLPNSTLVLAELQKATHGAVTDLELMQRTLKAANFGISLGALPPLLEFAAVRAQQTGVSVDYMVNSIVDGIGRKSLRVLDNLQISQSRIKEEMHGISLETASVAQVSEAMGRIASEELKKMGGFAETSATQVEKLEVSMNKLNLEVSKFGTQPALLKFYDFLIKNVTAGFQAITGGSKAVTEDIAKQRAIVEVSQFKELHLTKEILEEKQKAFDIVQQEANTRQQLIGRNNDELKHLQGIVDGWKKAEGEYAGYSKAETSGIAEQIRFYQFKNNVLKESIKILNEFNKAMMAPAPKGGTTTDGGKRSAPEALKQVVDFDLKNPVTGEVTKYDRDNVIKAFTDMVAMNAQVFAAVTAALQTKFTIQVSPPTVAMDAWDKIGVEFAERWREIASAGIQNTADLISSFTMQQADSYQLQLNNLRNFYDEQAKLAGDNERVKSELSIKREREEEKLRKKAFEAEKEAKRLQTIINGAAGVINAFATLPYPAAVVASVLIAGQTAAQLGVISKQEYTGRFAKGVIDLKGPGTKTSDSIPARLSKGESVMTADETNSSMGILKAVRARRLNDRVLKEVISGRSGGSTTQIFDDSRIISKLDEVKNATPNLERRGNLIYEGKKKGDNYIVWVRSKWVN